MDTSYYFVLEPDGKDDGPYRLHEIQRRVDVGLISRQASLCKTGDTTYVPLADPRFAEVLQPPRRAASGTAPVPVTPAAVPSFDIDIDVEPAKATQTLTPPPVAAMPPGFVPPVAAPVEDSFKPIVPAAPSSPSAPNFVPAPSASAAPSFVPAPLSAPTSVSELSSRSTSAAAATPSAPSFVPAAASPIPAAPSSTPLGSTPSFVPPSPVESKRSAKLSNRANVVSPSSPASKVVPPAPQFVSSPSAQLVSPPHAQFVPPPPAFVAQAQFVPPPPAFVAPAQFVPLPPAHSGPSGQLVPSPPAHSGPSGQFVPPSPAHSGPSGQFVPPSPAHSGPSGQFVPSPPAQSPAQSAAQVQQFAPAQAYAQPLLPAPQPLLPAPSSPEAGDLTAETPMQLLTAEELGLDASEYTNAHAQPLVPAQFAQPQLAQPQLAQLAQPQLAQPQLAQLAQPQLAQPQLAQPQLPQAQQALPPSAPSKLHAKKKHIALAAGAIGLVGAVGIGYAVLGGNDNGVAKDAIVRVTTSTGAGTGFLIQGPDRYAYVATANHVVDRGERVLVERDVGADGHTYIEAYPETEVVATDPDADLAIIRIKNVDASRFAKLELASKPAKDEKILSYGYPGSSLARKPGLVSKDGKILSLVSFPAYDDRYARILRDNAVDGLLISTDIEQGMSGGPTLSSSGKVVGINVTKDRAHVGQNGAVSVVALRELVAKIQPAAKQTDATPDDVVALLEKIETEYMLLPIDERAKVRETDFVHPGDLPNLRNLVNEVRREERNTDTSFIAKYQLSGQAALGMFFARLPGKLLETYRAPSTVNPLLACELRSERLTSFLGDLSQTTNTPRLAADSCDELAVRPLAWDLAAATLQWDGKDKTYAVTKLEKMDEDGKIYRASVRISGASNLVELWLGVEQGKVRLKLFDTNNNLYAIKSPRSVPASSFQGTWSIKRPRVTDTLNKDAEVESSETLSISITDDRKVAIRNVVTEKYVTAASGRGGAFRCSGKRTIDTGLVQSFTGTLDNGVILAFPDKAAEEVGADAGYCKPSHKADRIVAIKLEGEQLTFYRTDGNAYPETVQLRRDAAVPAAPSN